MFRLRYPLLFLFLLFWSGCGSSSTVVEDMIEEAPVEVEASGGPFVVFTEREGSLLALDLPFNVERKLGDAGSMIYSSTSPNALRVVLGIESERKTELYLYNIPEQTRTVLFSGEKGTVFSGDWDPSSSAFYFGQYVPDGKRMGAGSIHSYTAATGLVERVPCSASRMVLRHLSDGALMVRNSDSIYHVSVSDCSTLQTIDARKLYHVSVSPTKDRMAYVLRDLVFNRDTRAYEPDSALYLASVEGGNEIKVIGDKYQPRNIVWSPDGKELAYDVAAQDGSSRRAVSIYSIDSGRSSYLETPTATSNSSSHPVFSPDGMTVAYRSTDPDGFQDMMWKTAGESFSHVTPGDPDVRSAYSFNWVGVRVAFVRSPSGEASILDVSAGEPQVRWSGPSAVFATPIR